MHGTRMMKTTRSGAQHEMDNDYMKKEEKTKIKVSYNISSE